MPKYQYTHDVPTVFISLLKDGHTWVPSKGDTIEVDEPIAHAHLMLVQEHDGETSEVVDTEPNESPDVADESKEN